MKCTLAVLVVVLLASGVARADVTLFDFTKGRDVDEWHGVPLGKDGSVTLTPGAEPFWTCWSVVDNWENFGKLVLDVDAAADGAEVCVGVSDDDEATVAVAARLKKGPNTIALGVKELFEAGIQTQHVRGIVFFARKMPCVVTPRKVALVGQAADLLQAVRRGVRVLTDAEGRAANFYWSYSHWARRVAAVEKHAASGKRSFEMKFSGKGFVSGWGRFAHDWRGYDTLACEVTNPADKPLELTVQLKDTWVAMFSKAYVASKTFTLPARKQTTVRFPLADLAGKSGSAGEGKLNRKYIQQMLFRVQEEDLPAKLYVDDIRLVGKEGDAFENQLAAADVPKFGFERHAPKLKLASDFRSIDVAEPKGGYGTLRVGAARVKLDAKIGYRMGSVASKAEGILDDVHVRAFMLQEEGKDLIAWANIENIYVPGRNEVTAFVGDKLGVKPENVFWSSTHNHNCPAPWARKAFNQNAIDAFCEAAAKAKASMKPVRLALATTQARFNFNRVLAGPDGKYYSTLDAKYMSCLYDSRPTDTDLAMLWFVGEDKRPVAGVVYYTGHANMNCRVLPWVSGDYTGWSQRLLEASSDAVVMHVVGAIGDVDMRGNGISVGRTIRAGWDVAYTASKACEKKLVGINPAAMAGVSVRHGTGVGSPSEKQRVAGALQRTLSVRALTIGPVVFVDVGGELWTTFGLDIKRYSPFPYTYVNYSSGHYFPAAWAFEKKLYGTKGRQPDWGGVVRDTAIKTLKQAAWDRE